MCRTALFIATLAPLAACVEPFEVPLAAAAAPARPPRGPVLEEAVDTGQPTGSGNWAAGVPDLLVTLSVEGEAVASEHGWLGTEQHVWRGEPSGALLCAHTWTTRSDPAGPEASVGACVDPDGKPCAFGHVVLFEDRVEDGPCDGVFARPEGDEPGPVAYGYSLEYHARGTAYGPAFMSWDPDVAAWVGIDVPSHYEPATGELHYKWLQGTEAL